MEIQRWEAQHGASVPSSMRDNNSNCAREKASGFVERNYISEARDVSGTVRSHTTNSQLKCHWLKSCRGEQGLKNTE